jgi:hypothetical protein
MSMLAEVVVEMTMTLALAEARGAHPRRFRTLGL